MLVIVGSSAIEDKIRLISSKDKEGHGFSTVTVVGIIVGCICAVALIITVSILGVRLVGKLSVPESYQTPTGIITGAGKILDHVRIFRCR